MKGEISNIWSFIKRHKYIFFAIFAFFFIFNPTSEMGSRWSNHKKINKIKAGISYYNDKISESEKVLNDLNTPENLERYARENFYMKKDNEDLFIVKE